MKEQYELDKMTMMKKLEDEQNKLKQEFNQNLSQKESELKEALSKLDQKNKIKLEKVLLQSIYYIIFRFNNIINHYHFQILINIIIVNQVKLENLWQKLLIVVNFIIVFVNKQFQRLEKYSLHFKYLVDQIFMLEQDLETLCRNIIIRIVIKLEHIQQIKMVIFIHMIHHKNYIHVTNYSKIKLLDNIIF
ncbi:unnamed protein product [Paramecium primaurelia]|uniref:Uncharacterized protein n=1 Tax=Paramecium primaurelia TaxID=5886 RepID=A0A8S1NQQ5_PARPR|nr:unnamed protein product [Paramecium primaurelia]